MSLLSAAPVMEQVTHFCDLSRYFGGEVDISSVTAHTLEWDEKARQRLSMISINESKTAPENRIPRVTSATWYVSSDLFRSNMAGFAFDYHCAGNMIVALWAVSSTSSDCMIPTTAANLKSLQMDILSSAPRMSIFLKTSELTGILVFWINDRLMNPYTLPVLFIRRPGDDEEHPYNFPDDNPLLSKVCRKPPSYYFRDLNLVRLCTLGIKLDRYDWRHKGKPRGALEPRLRQSRRSADHYRALFAICSHWDSICSTDAHKTRELTSAIREASERSRKKIVDATWATAVKQKATNGVPTTQQAIQAPAI